MLALMKKNIAINNLEFSVTAAVYDWGKPTPDCISELLSLHGGKKYPDIIIAADCVYFEPTFPLLLTTLTDLIGPSTTCYFCFKKRRKADWRFIKDMQKNLECSSVEYADNVQDQREGIYLYHVTRKQLKQQNN